MYIGRNRKAAMKLLEAAGWDYSLLKRGLSAATRDPSTGEIRFSDAMDSIRTVRGEPGDDLPPASPLRRAL